MVTTGKSYPNEEKVEIIDLFDPQWKYEFLNPRLARYGAVGNLVQNKSLICGGIRTMSNKKYLQNGLGKITTMIHISVPYWQLTLLFFIMGQKMKKPSRQGREVSEG